MRIRATAAMAAVLLCAAISASAQTLPPGQFKVCGDGLVSCGKWLDDRQGDGLMGQHDLSWVLGWLTATGYYTKRPLRETDGKAVTAWVDKYCRENPLKKIAAAAASLVDELSKPK